MLDFGAKGDGTRADESPYLQKALDQGGKEVYIPGGTYRIQRTLRVKSGTRIKMDANTTILRNDDIDCIFLLDPGSNVSGYNGISDVFIEGGNLNLNKYVFPNRCTGIAFSHSRRVTIEKIKMVDCPIGSHFIKIHGSHHVRVRDCYLENSEDEAIQIASSENQGQFPWYGSYDQTVCHDVAIEGCRFDTVGSAVRSVRPTNNIVHYSTRLLNCHIYGVRAAAIHFDQSERCIIENNYIAQCFAGIVMVDSAFNSVVSNNIIRVTDGGTNGYGIYVKSDNGTASTMVISGNNLSNMADTGIRIENAYRITLIGNSIRTCGLHGIGLYNTEDSTVANNTVTFCTQHGIYLATASENTISGNLSKDNQRTGASAGHANIRVVINSHNNNIQGNTVRAGTYTDYGISVTNTCVGNMITNNDCYNGGKVANFQNNGLGTITTAGNRT